MCKYTYSIITLLISLLSLPNIAFAVDLLPVESNVQVIKGNQIRKVEGNVGFSVAKSMIVPPSAYGSIPYNQRFGVLSMNILSPTKSQIIVKWDNENFLYPRFEPNKVRFLRAGANRQLNFNVTSPVSGHVYLYNTRNQLLAKIPYHVKKQSRYIQSITGRLNGSENDNALAEDNDYDQSYSINYNISQRAPIGQPRLRGGITFRSNIDDEDGFDNRSGSAYLGISW